MQRRHFLSGMIAGIAGMASPAVAQRTPIPTGPVPRLCRVRPNVNSLSADQLDALKKGVEVMMSRPASDPTSWAYQAAIHGTTMSPAKPLWNQCQHGTLHFLSWHRLFLYRFELILRKASGSSSLNLPFWDWTAHRELPAPFRDTAPGNPLFTTHRNAAVNGGALLPASAVAYSSDFAQVPFANFSGSLEGTPHGTVHTSIGGWMAFISQSAQDPIFWLHHANIDRLWSLWLAQGGGRQNPSTSSWLNQSFSFFNEDGQQVSMTAKQTVDSCRNLGYIYETVPAIIVKPPLVASIPTPQLVAATTMRAVEPQSGGSVSLGPQPAEVVFAMAPARAALRLARPSGGGHIYLSFENIQVSDPEGYYEVYLNPAAGTPLEPTDPSYAGNLVLFGLEAGGTDHSHMGPPSRMLDITQKLSQLRLDASQLRVVLVLREPEGAGAGKASAARAQVGSVRLMAGP